jgi:hypothetical protein
MEIAPEIQWQERGGDAMNRLVQPDLEHDEVLEWAAGKQWRRDVYGGN